MNILVISGTPKTDGLCVSLVEAAQNAAIAAEAECDVVTLSRFEINRCAMCGDGWGTCRTAHSCAFGEDGFSEVQERVNMADALVLISPVYWGETSEVMKAMLDRLRRCEASKRFGDGAIKSALDGKKCLLVASPGGSGNGLLTALEQLDRAVRHMNGEVFDYIGVNRFNKEYKTAALEAAVKALAQS